ncbi:MAG: CpaF family protein [Anaerolineae bacterium]|nr:CpaF family protein [Anaerolineae bacterium]
MNKTVSSEDIIKIVAFLDPLLADDSIWEIMIDGYDRVLVSRGGSNVEQVESPFSSPDEFQALIDGLFGLYGIRLDATNPVGYLRLPDHSRVMAIVPPNAVDGPHLVLRRIYGARPTWEQLIAWNSVPQKAYDLLKSAIAGRVNILVSGGTGSGKTTLASRIVELTPPEERIVIVERVYEMQVENPRVVRLEAGGPANLGFEDLLVAATRMRPDRLIVGNVDGPIAAAALQHLGSGYDGSLMHIHSTSVQDALNRLESFCLMADLGLGLDEIRQLIASGLGLITYQEHLPDGSRKLVDIVELRGIENRRYVLEPLMRYNRVTGQFEYTEVKPGWLK